MAAPRAPQDHQRRRPGVQPVREPASLVEIISTDVEEITDEPVFSIDGTVYTMPVPVPASFSLQALDMMAKEGEVTAMMWVVEELVGTEGYDALKNCQALTTDQLTRILDKIQFYAIGGLEEGTRGN